MLAYDLDPKVAYKFVGSMSPRPEFTGNDNLAHLYELADRAVTDGKLRFKPSPFSFMTWARSVGVAFHPDWWAAVPAEEPSPVRRRGKPLPAAKPVAELGTREQESLLKLVVGMAIGGYRWNRDKAKEPANKEIADDLARAGVPLDPDTIRKWLRKGAELLPGKDP